MTPEEAKYLEDRRLRLETFEGLTELKLDEGSDGYCICRLGRGPEYICPEDASAPDGDSLCEKNGLAITDADNSCIDHLHLWRDKDGKLVLITSEPYDWNPKKESMKDVMKVVQKEGLAYVNWEGKSIWNPGKASFLAFGDPDLMNKEKAEEILHAVMVIDEQAQQ